MTDVFIGRQPVFDRDLNVNAYELLSCGTGGGKGLNQENRDRDAARVILSAFIDIGLENLVGPYQAYIRLTSAFLQYPNQVLLPPGQIVLQILGRIEPDENTLRSIKVLKQKGHTIAFGTSVFQQDQEPFLELANMIRFDVASLSQADIEAYVYQARHGDIRLVAGGIRLIASEIDTYDKFESMKRLDFDCYQGYFFSKPRIIHGKSLESSQAAILQLLGEINREDVDIPRLSQLISCDVPFSHKILKFINSSASGVSVKVGSVLQAIVLLGLSTIKKWISVVALLRGSDKPDELLNSALVRAHACEQLSIKGRLLKPDNYFTLGLFSLLDAMMDQPMDKLMSELPFPDDMKLGMLDKSGDYGRVLSCVIAMEQNELESIQFEDLELTQLATLYQEALVWADHHGRIIRGL